MDIDIASFGRAALFLGIPFVLWIFYLQWKWARDCDNSVRVLVAQQSGSGKFLMAPKEGGSVTIQNPHTGTTRTWPINELATIDVPYPGVGFVPNWLQKKIRLAIVNEGDWEPMLNRSAHMHKVASPDMVTALTIIAGATDPKTRAAIEGILDGVATAPTREMIASPAVLGNLMQEKISELAVTVAKDIVNPLNEAIKKLGQTVNPTIVYVGLGLILVVLVFSTYQVMQLSGTDIGTLGEDIARIKEYMGIP